MKSPFLALAVLAAAACSTADAPQRFQEYRFSEGREHVGRIYHYLRTNRDGSSPEHIHVFHKSSREVEVYKMVERCTNAALVTADLDYDIWSATRLVGGRLTREGTQDGFAVLTLDADAPRIDAVVKLPEQEIRQSLDLTALPWRLYDFDFAEFTVFSQHLRDYRKGFSVDMAVVSTNAQDGQFLIPLGIMRATAEGVDRPGGVYRYSLDGGYFEEGGTLALDAREGHVVEFSASVPNHDGYDDLLIVLKGVSDGGAEEWRQLLLSHYEGCDAAS